MMRPVWLGVARCLGRRRGVAESRQGFIRDERAQGTIEYALTVIALLAVIVGLAALWRASAEGVFGDLVRDAASHALEGTGFIDISLY